MTAGAAHGRCRRIHFGLKRCGNPYIRRHSQDGTTEPWWCDADERIRVAVETDRLADQRPVPPEHPLPERMRDDRHANRRRDLIFVRRKPAADGHGDSKNVEVIAAHELAGQRFWLAVRIHGDGHFCIGHQ